MITESDDTNELILLKNTFPEFWRQQLGRRHLLDFTLYTKPNYQVNWHHRVIAETLDQFVSGQIKNLILTVPPQHGKSEMVSRRLPAFILGNDPDKKIVVASYSASLANSFNTDVQGIIEDDPYQTLFPGTKLNRMVQDTTVEQTQNRFRVVGHEGFLKSVGVRGALTGTAVDIAIIDDPIKDASEADSELIRRRIWEWYVSVLETRLHNASQKIICMTRWHEDDLVGRLLDLSKNDPDAEQWTVINLEAILEDETTKHPDDPRELGEALWEVRHSKENLMKQKRRSDRIFTAMYQGRPAPQEGNIIKSKWFDQFTMMELLNASVEEGRDIIPQFFIDSAFTGDKSKNDPTAIMTAVKMGNFAYILHIARVWKEFPEVIKFILEYVEEHDYIKGSHIFIEPKASGKSIAQQLRKKTSLSVIDEIDFINLTDSKEVRAHASSPDIESRRVKLLKNSPWIPAFNHEVDHFPFGKHDDQIDILVMMCGKFFGTGGGMSWRSMG